MNNDILHLGKIKNYILPRQSGMCIVLWKLNDKGHSKELRGTILGLITSITIRIWMLGYRPSPSSAFWLGALSFLVSMLKNVATTGSQRKFTAFDLGYLQVMGRGCRN